MFFRLKKSGERGYVQIVENKRDGAAVRQRVIANVGRADELAASGALASLIASGAKLTDQVLLINALDEDAEGALSVTAKRIGGPMLFGRIWERLGVADVLTHLLKERAFEFPVERAVFVAALHRLFVSGSDRDCWSWMEDYDIPGAEGLDLHHFYRAMAWLGEEVEEKPEKGAGAALRQGPDRGEAVRPPPRSIHRPLHRIHGHHQPLLLRRGRRDARRARLLQGLSPRPEADDPRPRRRRRRAADLHRDVAGNTADVTSLLPVVDRLRKRFSTAGSASSQTAANSCAKTLNRSGSMSRLRRPSITVASSVSRRMVRRLPQTVSPLLRAVEQPKCASLILEKPPPQTPQRIRPEKR